MKSIKAKFLVWLLPCILILQVIAGISLYQYKKSLLISDLKFSLVKWTGNAKAAGNKERNPNTPTPTKQVEYYLWYFYDYPSYLNPENKDEKLKYYQILSLDRKVLKKSENLFFKIKSPEKFYQHHQIHRQVYLGEEYLISSIAIAIKGKEVFYLSYAINTKVIKPRLNSFLQKLVLFSILSFIVLTALILSIFHFALKPIRKLEQHAQSLTLDHLNQSIDEKQMPKELKGISSKLNELMKRIHSSFEREKQFANDVAHELRTPLAAIRSTAEVAVKWPNKQPLNDFQDIEKVSTQMQSLVDGLMMLSRYETKNFVIEKHFVDVNTIISEAILQNKNKLKEKNIKIELIKSYSEDIKIDLQSNRTLLQIVISNLINNAVSHCKENNTITIIPCNENFIFSISNHAPLIKEEDLSNIFQRLWKKDSSRSDSNHSGLGLSIAMRCATLLELKIQTQLDDKNNLIFKII